jgi:hypothetical protein
MWPLCQECAVFHLVGEWGSGEDIWLNVCLVHVPAGIKELQAFRIDQVAPRHVRQVAMRDLPRF